MLAGLPSGMRGSCKQRAGRPALGTHTARATVVRVVAKKADVKTADTKNLSYGSDWYQKTRDLSSPRTVREELARRREANAAANNGRERKDLYTDNWEGSEYKGSRWNILTLLAALFLLVPVAGLVFAYFTYGELWG